MASGVPPRRLQVLLEAMAIVSGENLPGEGATAQPTPAAASTEHAAAASPHIKAGVVLSLVFPFASDKEFLFLAGVSRSWRASWVEDPRRGAATSRRRAAVSVSRLSWSRDSGLPWDPMTCRCIAREGHLDVLAWARDNLCPWDAWTCANAVRAGHLAVLAWAQTRGCGWDAETCTNAALGGNLGVLRWARANGCPWDEHACRAAAEAGHLEVLRWARANGAPWDARTCEGAAREGHLEVTPVVGPGQRVPLEREHLLPHRGAGALEVFKWAREAGAPGT